MLVQNVNYYFCLFYSHIYVANHEALYTWPSGSRKFYYKLMFIIKILPDIYIVNIAQCVSSKCVQ